MLLVRLFGNELFYNHKGQTIYPNSIAKTTRNILQCPMPDLIWNKLIYLLLTTLAFHVPTEFSVFRK